MNDHSVLRIAPIGIPKRDMVVLKYLIRLSSSTSQHYDFATEGQTPDILLVDGDNPEAMQEWRALSTQPRPQTGLPTIILSKEHVLREAPLYGLQRPLVASRVFSVLEQTILTRRVATLQYRALVVDDSLTVRKQVQIELDKLGIAATLAPSAEEAFAILDKGEAYDLIFLDVVLPGANGYDVCKAIKTSKQRKSTPVIMLTGKGSLFNRMRGKLVGCNTYLTKPVGRTQFQSTVRKYLPDCTVIS